MENFNRSLSGIRFTYIIVLVLVSIISYLSYKKIQTLLKVSEIVNQTNIVLAELENSISILKDAETGQRGYLLTGDSLFLKPYYMAHAEEEASLKRLETLVNGNTTQEKDLKLFKQMARTRLAFLAKLVSDYANGPISKAELYKGKVLMDNARLQIRKMSNHEKNLLAIRSRQLENETIFAPVMLFILTGCTCLILALSYFKIISELKQSNELQERLKNKEADLTMALENLEASKNREVILQTVKRFELISNTMPQFIWTADKEGVLNYFSQSVFDYTGFTNEEIFKIGWLEIVHPDDREENIREWLAAVSTGEAFTFEHRFRNKNGEYRWQLSRALPQRAENGDIETWVGTSTDIQDQKLFASYLEKSVAERTAELLAANHKLEESNAELAQFAYVASHDLQEPLRKINTFISRIEEYEKDLPAKTTDYFERIRNAARKMQQLISDILAFSRTSENDSKYEPVDLNEVLNFSIDGLSNIIASKKAKINAVELPEINGVPYQLEQLFSNLINNALKFSKENIPPIISITYHEAGMEEIASIEGLQKSVYHKIVFSDNGIGFEQEYADRIFNVFQRLNSKDAYEGTGIGLAIVRKIIANHKGAIRATGIPDTGATFEIFLPKG